MIGGLLRRGLGALGDVVFPGVCGSCGQREVDSAGLCTACCRDVLELVSLPYCPRCGATLAPHAPPGAGGCYQCPQPLPRAARVVRLGPYASPLRPAVHAIKYRYREDLRRYLGRTLAEAALTATAETPPDVVLPVPMHWKRRIRRGYDAARELARSVAAGVAAPLGHELRRRRATPPQVHLSRTARIQNVRNAFAAADLDGLSGAHVLLVDDVTTTGATADECVRTLHHAGAERVTLAVIAKAEPPRNYRNMLDQA